MGGSQQTGSTVTQSTDPNITATIDKLLTGSGGVQDIFSQGSKSFDQPLYVPAGSTTQQGWNTTLGAANNPTFNNGVQSGLNFNSSLIGSGGLTGGQQGSLDQLNSLYGGYGATGGLNPVQGDLQGALSTVGAKYGATGGLNDIQSSAVGDTQRLAGDYGYLSNAYGTTNPAIQAQRNNLINDTTSNVNSIFNNSGRFGGGSNVQALGEGLGNALANYDVNLYDKDVANRYNAVQGLQGLNSSLFNMGQQGTNNTLNSLAGQANTYQTMFGNSQQGTANTLNALQGQQGVAQNAFTAGQQGVTNNLAAQNGLNGLFQSSLLPGQTISGVGSAQDADANAQRQAASDLFTRGYNAPTDRLAQLSSILAGNSAGAGTTSSTYQNQNLLNTILGGALGIGSLLL